MKRIQDRINRFAPLPWPVLLLGETGSGKELAARAVHERSSRRDRTFLAANVAAIPESLFDSEMFGHTQGSFTGANTARAGLLEMADEGTLFLDEINSLPLGMQEKLLRVLQEREIRRVGDHKTIPVDVRFITATNTDLVSLCDQRKFRLDLYHRLNVLPVTLPPLRERREDIPQLAACFLDRIEKETGRAHSLDKESLDRLRDHEWPGNIRELENALRHAVAVAESNLLSAELFGFLGTSPDRPRIPELLTIEEYSRRALEEWGPSMSRKELASRLGVSRKTLWDMRKRWGIS